MNVSRRSLFYALALFGLSAFCSAQTSDAAPAEDSAAVSVAATKSASIPHTVRYSGVLRGADGTARTGVATVTFSFYGEAQGGSPLYLETQNVQLDEQGRYAVLLGATSSAGLPLNLFSAGEARWLGVRVAEEGAVEQPRVALVSVPYALAAGDAQLLNGRPATDYQLTRTAAAASGESQAAGSETSGAVSSSANTVNRVAKFTGVDTVGDSTITEVGGKVGIGTSSPVRDLHLRSGAPTIRLEDTNFPNSYWELQQSAFVNDTFGFLRYENGAAVESKSMVISNAGFMGLGTGAPARPLHIKSATPAIRIQDSTLPNSFWELQQSAFVVDTFGFLRYENGVAVPGKSMVISAGGDMGLGTTVPGAKLDVAGIIRSTSGGFKFPDGTIQTTAATGSGGGAGDITAVIAGTGLSGGATSGDATLSVNAAVVQSRVAGTCASGNYVRVINQDGSVTCGTDQTGAGGIAYPYSSGDQNTASSAFKVIQTNSVVLAGDPTFSSAQSGIPAGVVGVASATSNTAAGVAGFTSSANGVAVVGWNGSTTGTEETDASGVLGVTDNNAGVGVTGEAHAATGFTRGVEGRSASSSGVGVRGRADSLSGSTTGLVGEVVSPNGVAGYFFAPAGTTSFLLRGGNGGPDVFKVDGNGTVFAAAYKDLNGNPIGGGSGTITGVTAGSGLTGGGTSGSVNLAVDSSVARTNANNNFSTSQNITGGLTATGVVTAAAVVSDTPDGGVLGRDTDPADTYPRVGVQGIIKSPRGSGVSGISQSITGLTSGVSGSAASDSGAGLYGVASSTTGFTAGARGISMSPSGAGVRGDNMPSSANAAMASGFGVRGSYGLNQDFTLNSNASNGIGVMGENLAANGTGVQAEANGSGTTIGLYAKVVSNTGTAAVLNNVGGGTILRGLNNGTEKFKVAGDGNVTAIKFTGDGSALTGITATSISGTIADSVLSSNVPLRDAANTFTAAQTVSGSSSGNLMSITQTGAGNGLYVTSATTGTGTATIKGENTSPTINGTSARGVLGSTVAEGGRGVQGQSTALTGTGYGVIGFADNAAGYGVFGQASAANGTGAGVQGTSLSTTGSGVVGFTTSTTGVTAGVWGEGPSTAARGVVGYATSTSGVTTGVWGDSASATGRGVFGWGSSLTGTNYGVWGQTYSPDGRGVIGLNFATTGLNYGVRGESNSPNGTGAMGLAVATTGAGIGVSGFASSPDGYALFGRNQSTTGTAIGVMGKTDSTAANAYGVRGDSPTGIGVVGITTNTTGDGWGVLGQTTSTDANAIGVRGVAPAGVGVYGRTSQATGSGVGVFGITASTDSTSYGVRGEASGNAYAGYFVGKVHVTGTLSKASGTFKIDHPLDPEHKYLSHSFVESPDMMNVYNGNTVLDEAGQAWIELPGYFSALNRDFRYQLTSIGRPQPQLYVMTEVQGNRFQIAGGLPGGKVSWQVTGIRQDAYARQNPVIVEQDKPAEEMGTYLNPEAFGVPAERGAAYRGHPEEIQQGQGAGRSEENQANSKGSVRNVEMPIGRPTAIPTGGGNQKVAPVRSGVVR